MQQRGEKMKKIVIGLLLLAGVLSACAATPRQETTVSSEPLKKQEKKEEVIQELIVREGTNLESRVKTPEGFQRTQEKKGSLGEFLRTYPLKPHGSPVLLFDKKKKRNQGAHEAVFQMNLGSRDLQQCADSIMRVYAEYLYQSGQKDKIAFHFVDGFLCDYKHWRQGYRVAFQKNGKPYWSKKAGAKDDREVFEKYLNVVFAYSSTLSMVEETKKISPKDLKIGDVFLRGGSPGHIVMVVDTCKNRKGELLFLLAQGYMPAQEFHLLKNPQNNGNPWYRLEEGQKELSTPEYGFSVDELRRVVYLD